MKLDAQQLQAEDFASLAAQCRTARGAILHMTTLASSGHPGGSMSTIDFLLTLYHMIEVDPAQPNMPTRDRVIFSHGHVSPAAYATLGLMGFFPLQDAISQFRLAGSIFEGHVEPDVPGIEWASGNLGQGLSAGCGFALAAKQKGLDSNVFVLMGDGEQQKGQLSEARRFAVKHDLTNITAFCDYNQLQISGNIHDVMPQNILDNYLSDGWDVIEIDGHDLQEIATAISDAVVNEAPTLILAHTTMGKGVSFMENREKFHGSTLSESQLADALAELNVPNNLDLYKKLRADFVPQRHELPASQDFSIQTTSRTYTEKTDNRSAWGNALADIATTNPDLPMAVFDCDLAGSVKTNSFAKVRPECFIQGGIMEHNAAVAAGALSKEGIQTYFSDFGVFGVDETYNQHRLSDINRTNLKVVTTHVGLDVGEDGKTHQCIDYLGCMRNLYHFHTIIPADPNQTDRVIRYISGKYGNYLVPMGRSKLDLLRHPDGSLIFGENYRFCYGKADKLRDGADAALLTMGTVANRAVEVADILAKEGINLQVWNISCPDQMDEDALRAAAATGTVFTYEDHNVHTGLGAVVADALMQMQKSCHFVKFGVEDYAISGKSDDVFAWCELDTASIVKRIKKLL
ncbi:MAG: transketolase [Candidatus Cloacimonetes bacterium]|nr:transketolase [Candidatus Cloacimonadota bacterium]